MSAVRRGLLQLGTLMWLASTLACVDEPGDFGARCDQSEPCAAGYYCGPEGRCLPGVDTDAGEADAGAVDAASSDLGGGDAAVADALMPDALTLDAAQADASSPDALVSDALVSDALLSDQPLLDVVQPDLGRSDAALPDTPVADAIACADEDGDGFFNQPGCGSALDCNDLDFFSNPDALDIPGNGADEDCRDGDLTVTEENGVFVNYQAPGGSGSRISPYSDIDTAVSQVGVKKNVFIASGDYTAVTISADVNLLGGFDPGTWQRGGSAAATHIQATGGADYSINNQSGFKVGLDGLTIKANYGGPTTTIAVISGGELRISDCYIEGGRGSNSKAVIVSSGGTLLAVRASHLVGCTGGTSNPCTAIFSTDGTVVVVDSVIEGGQSQTGSATAVNISSGNDLAVLVNNHIVAGSSGHTSTATALYGWEPFTALNNTFSGGDGTEIELVGLRTWQPFVLMNNAFLRGAPTTRTWAVKLDQADIDLILDHNGSFIPEGQDCAGVNESNNCLTAPDFSCATWGIDCEAQGGFLYSVSAPLVESDGVHLSPGSVLEDQGEDPSSRFAAEAWITLLAAHDLDGDSRPQGSGWDVGADERRVP